MKKMLGNLAAVLAAALVLTAAAAWKADDIEKAGGDNAATLKTEAERGTAAAGALAGALASAIAAYFLKKSSGAGPGGAEGNSGGGDGWSAPSVVLLLVLPAAMLLPGCTSVQTDPKSGIVSKTEFLPPAAFWEVLGRLANTASSPTTPVQAVKVRAEK